jgi:uncharacterized membrane protein
MGTPIKPHFRRTTILLRYILAAFFILAGANHYRGPRTYIEVSPRWLPWPAALNVVAGSSEILLVVHFADFPR